MNFGAKDLRDHTSRSGDKLESGCNDHNDFPHQWMTADDKKKIDNNNSKMNNEMSRGHKKYNNKELVNGKMNNIIIKKKILKNSNMEIPKHDNNPILA